jgi:hypothetical protein
MISIIEYTSSSKARFPPVNRKKTGPKMTSTMIIKKGDDESSSPEGKAAALLPPSSNGYTPKKSPKKVPAGSNKKVNKSSTSQSFSESSGGGGLSTTVSEGSTPKKSKAKKGKNESTKSQPAARTPRSHSREFAGISLLSEPVNPSPTVRITAKVEGMEAKPMTTFEREVNNEPVDMKALNKSATLWGRINTQELVYARWRDKKYYSGVVLEKWTNDTWKIDFDDGMVDVASETHIIPIKILGVGISGVYTPDSSYKPFLATVLGQKL